MGNQIAQGSAKVPVDELQREFITEALEHGNPQLCCKDWLAVTMSNILECVPTDSPTDPRHAYCYLGALIKDETNVSDSDMAEFLEAHPTALYGYITGTVVSDSKADVRNELLSLPLKGDPGMLGLLVVQTIAAGGVSASEMGLLYPTQFPELLTTDTTDDQLYWLLLSGQDPNGMEVPADQKPRWLAAMIRADMYACYEQFTSEDLQQMLPDILKRWHYLRSVSRKYLNDVVMPYYRPLFDFYLRHNGLNHITEKDLDLLTFTYHDIFGKKSYNWLELTTLERSICCLTYEGMCHMLGGGVRTGSYHEAAPAIWCSMLTEMGSSDGSVTPVGTVCSHYFGQLAHDTIDKTSQITDGNTTSLGGDSISEYNRGDIVLMYDDELTHRYYITRLELHQVLKDKVNPYTQEPITEFQIENYQRYLAWHVGSAISVVPWKAQWELLKSGSWFTPIPEVLEKLLMDYTLGEQVSDETDVLGIDLNSDQIPNKQDMLGMLDQANDKITDETPMAENIRGIINNFSQMISQAPDSIGRKSTDSKIVQIDDEATSVKSVAGSQIKHIGD